MQNSHNLGHVVVVCGGNSEERVISLVSGEKVYTALKKVGVYCSLLDTKDHGIRRLLVDKPDRVFIALHGSDGENGVVQGFLKTMGIPFTGSDTTSSALAMNKYHSKLVWVEEGLSTPPFFTVTQDVLPDHFSFYPCFVKAATQGSSIGCYQVLEEKDLRPALRKALTYSRHVIVEKSITGGEFSVSILGTHTFPVVRVKPASSFYDYHSKYQANTTQYKIPSGLTNQEERALQTLALKAFQSLGCSGWGRVDVMQDAAGKFWLMEVNTVPGMTPSSLVPMSAKAEGLSFSDLIIAILNYTLTPATPSPKTMTEKTFTE